MTIDEIIQDTLLYIDAHIAEEISADILAARACFSAWHFSRLFQWRVGYSLMSYVRERRLAFAAHALNSGGRLIDIALEYGFETHSGFSKAFRRKFGCSPIEYRMHAKAAPPLPPNLSAMIKYAIGGIIMEPRFVTLPAIRLAGYALKTKNEGEQNNKDIPAFWSAYMSDGRAQKLHAEPWIKSHSEYGACFSEDPETGEFSYVIGLELKDGAAAPEGYYQCEIPAATYAVFSTPPCDDASFSPSIQGTWSYIFSEWFPNSGCEYAPGCVDFELYDERCMTENGKVCDIYLPVVRKA